MFKEIQISVPPKVGFDMAALRNYLSDSLALSTPADNFDVKIKKRSIDARAKQVKVNLTVEVFVNEPSTPLSGYVLEKKDVSNSPQAIIVGAGPAGLFAALRLIEKGIKPVILERGKNVRDRRRDLALLNKQHIVNPDSNYCFGEGGAGTYSDGKLYTRSDKRGNVRHVLEILHYHGAPDEILYEAHPHIGTNKLPQLIENIRNTIVSCGGEIHFQEKVTDFIISHNTLKGCITQNGKEFIGIATLLATGHSARDIFYLLHKKNILIENKPFALGVRAEHSQQWIDSLQYHCESRGNYLPPAAYSLVTQAEWEGSEKGVFSFCMCPGGIIAPCATEPGEVVVNGWSPSKRNNYWACSGIVTAVDEADWKQFAKHGPLAALEFQKSIEQKACQLAGGNQTAPAQRISDFVAHKLSVDLPKTSYQPGIKSVIMHEVLPTPISERLKKGVRVFDKKMKGYLTHEAQILGVESRTSSPVRIPRHKETCEHPHIKRLFPCGEGAGYAGGIVSAAMDGQRCAESLALLYGRK